MTIRISALCMVLITVSGAQSDPSPYWVGSVGDRMRIMHSNDLSGHVDLRTLQDIPHLYALGPLAELKGEITIYDGEASISTIENGQPLVSDKLQGEAIFLLYGSASAWQRIEIPQAIDELATLETYVERTAAERGLDISDPFPFRIEGVAETMTYHIIFKADEAPHSHAEHHKAKYTFDVTQQDAKFIGFWVDAARVGKLTHPGERTHLHTILKDNRSSGHVDALQLAEGATLYLPLR